MRKQWLALMIMALGLTGFIFMETVRGVQAVSPYFASRKLAGQVIGVDAGHGGYDGGCVGKSGVEEKQLNLEVAQKLKEELEDRGAVVIMTREEDVALIDPKTTTGYKKRKELSNRIAMLNEAGAEMLISIHMNEYSDASQRGAQVFYLKGGAAEGRDLALAVTESLQDMDGQYTRTAAAGEYYILNACDAAVLVECGFMSNVQEEQLLQTEKYQKKLAAAIADGVEQYFRRASVQ